jgi:hypothetical protein
MVGLAAILLARPAQALLDYPRVDALLRVGTPIALEAQAARLLPVQLRALGHVLVCCRGLKCV